MKKALGVATAALVSATIFSPAASAQQNPSAEALESVRDSWIFVFKDDVAKRDVPGRAVGLVEANGGAVGHVYSNAIKGFSARMPASAAARLAANNPNIAYYERDMVMTAFPKGGNPGGGKPGGGGGGGGGTDPAQEMPWGITRVGAPQTAPNVSAWVIDSGVDQDHPDLNVDTARSANFVSKGKNTKDDGNGHGTHVAGTIGAIDNDIGVVGVAPGVTIVGIRVLDDRGSGSTSGVIAGVDYVAANAGPGDVANMSLGGGVSTALDQAVINAASSGVKFALAAGNSSIDANNSSPARANHPNIWTVSASDNNDAMAYFSNYGNPPVECAAPGVSVLSTYKDGGYATLSGTSMASPHVAGLLLFGGPSSDGFVSGDPDGNPDPICHY